MNDFGARLFPSGYEKVEQIGAVEDSDGNSGTVFYSVVAETLEEAKQLLKYAEIGDSGPCQCSHCQQGFDCCGRMTWHVTPSEEYGNYSVPGFRRFGFEVHWHINV